MERKTQGARKRVPQKARKATTAPRPSQAQAGGGKSRTVTLEDHDALIPAKGAYADYIDRQFDGQNVLDLYSWAERRKHNVVIMGPTGCGKTMSAYAYADLHRKPIYAINAHSGKTIESMVGRWVPDGKGGFMWVDGPLTHIVRYGGVGVFDEVNFLNEKIQSGTFSLLDKRRYLILEDKANEIVYAHDDLLLIATGNPGYQGTRDLNYAFKNRFGLKLSWDYDPAVEAKLVTSRALLDLAQRIRKQTVDGDFDTPTPTNALMEFEQIAKEVSYDFAVTNFIAAYDDDERPAIKNLLDLSSVNIRNELFPKPKPEGAPETLEDFVDEFDVNTECDNCGEEISVTAVKCPFCKSVVS